MAHYAYSRDGESISESIGEELPLEEPATAQKSFVEDSLLLSAQPSIYPLPMHKLPSQADTLWNKLWLGEFLAWALSLICFAAVVIILALSDGHPLNRWHFGISLNTVIAILATMGNALLAGPLSAALGQTKWARFRNKERPVVQFQAIEDASRGPLGSIRFLTKRHGG